MKKEQYLGFDCGNSSVRTTVGTFDGSHISLDLIDQVPNREYQGIAYEYWDILAIFSAIQRTLKLAFDKYPDIVSFGISTWGIDFGLLGESGELLGNPLCYRNPLGTRGMEITSQSNLSEMFTLTGIQNHPMNSMYQLIGIREKLPEYYREAKKLLLIPDLLNHLLTGELNTESSITSTTQLLDMRNNSYSQEVFNRTGLKRELFVDLVPHGKVRGMLSKKITDRLGIPQVPAISVPSHDTAAAVVCVPSSSKDFAFISSGTWSLIGTELAAPIINAAVEKAGFANEGGAFDTITLLKNSCGMHILQKIKREMEFTSNRKYSWDEILGLMQFAEKNKDIVVFDPNAESLYNPTSMIDAITSLTGLRDLGQIIASACKSLAVSYKETIENLEAATGKKYDTIHIIGGGSRNAHLNQMTADISGKKVTSGPEEATSLGTIAVQVMANHPEMSLADIRAIVRSSSSVQEFLPNPER